VVHDGESGDSAGTEQTLSGPSPPSDSSTPSAEASRRPRARALLDKGSATVDRVKAGRVGTFWSRLTAVEVMNSAVVFAGLMLICFFPFLAVVDAAAGRNVQQTITIRMGLNAQAAHDVDALISTGHQTVSALSVLGAIVLVVFAIGIPGILQAWYQKVYDQPAAPGGVKQVIYKLVWVAGFLAYLALEVLVGRQVGPAGGHLLIFACEFAIAVLFWWWTVHFLLLGRISRVPAK
jgi:membrane protein